MVLALVEPLLQEAEQLQFVLTQPCDGQETAWVDQFALVLSRVEGSLSHHRPPSEMRLIDCAPSTNRGPYASLSRRVNGIKKNLQVLLGQVNGLLNNVQTSFLTHERLERLQREGGCIVQSLRRAHQSETAIMMEMALRDTGTGD